MRLLDFLSFGSFKDRSRVVLLAAVAGSSGTLAIVLTNTLVSAAISWWLFAIFICLAVLHLFTARLLLHHINKRTEIALQTLKNEIVAGIARADFAAIERIGPSEIQDRLTQNMATISSRASAIGSIMQAVVMFTVGMAYLAWLSFPIFAVLLPLTLLLIYGYQSLGRGAVALAQAYIRQRQSFLELLFGLLKGAKEIKLSRARRDEVLSDFDDASGRLRAISIRFNRSIEDNSLFLGVCLYGLLATPLFVLPQIISIDPASLPRLVIVLLFMGGSIQEGLSAYPGYVQATQALAAVGELRERLHGAADSASLAPSVPASAGSSPPTIESREIEYEYPAELGEKPFRIGPISLEITPGELIFIVGGNGSGKSTFLKVLTGLYRPSSGELRIAGRTLQPEDLAAYREQISAIFTDFHLFARLYGVLDASPDAVTPLLHKLRLAHKTSYVDGAFTQRKLSTGQRKRLALIVALLEDKPIVVFDEWAADQDPGFRQYFYEVLLPELKQRGKTVLAVSHDDRYFHCADRVLTLEYGTVRSLVSHRPAAEQATPTHE